MKFLVFVGLQQFSIFQSRPSVADFEDASIAKNNAPMIADVGYHFDIRIQLLDIRGHPTDVRKYPIIICTSMNSLI
ncbi:hypothetical protein BDW66DRAFT_155876 [Aspergillus desertorum]